MRVNRNPDVRPGANPFAARVVVVAGLAVISFVIGGSGIVAVGLFIGPIMKEFAWTNGAASSAATTFLLSLLLVAPAIGSALDRFGAKPVMGFGILAAAGGFLLLSHCHTRSEMLAAFTLVGIGYSGSFYVPCVVVVTSWMESRGSLGTGIVLGAVSLGAALFSPLLAWSIDVFGWRVTSGALALLVILMLPVTLLAIRTRPAFSPQTHDGTSRSRNLRQPIRVLLSVHFVIATTSSALFAIGLNGIYYHLVSLLVEAGYSPTVAGFVLGVSWVFSAVGALASGFIAGHSGAKTVFSGSLLCSAVGALFLLGVTSATFSLICVVAFLVLWGAPANSVNQFIPVIFAERFGSRDLGALIGVQSLVMGVAGAAAPVVTGMLYDSFGGYRPAIGLSASATFIAFVVALFIEVPGPHGKGRTSAPPA